MEFYQRVFLPDRPDLLPAPPPQGIHAVVSLLVREWRNLIKLNLLLIPLCLPIVTIGPTLAAETDLLLRMVRDEPLLLFPDFRFALRTHAKRGLFCCLSAAVSGIILACALYGYAHAGLSGHPLSLFPFMLACALSGVYLISLPYLLPLCTSTRLSVPALWKNAVLLGICHPLHTLASWFLVLMISVPFLLIWPVSLPFFALFVVILQLLILDWMAWRVIRRYLPSDPAENQEDSP